VRFILDLPFPAKVLWPNGRGHHMAVHRAFKKHKAWAHAAMLEVVPRCFRWNGEPARLHYTVTPKTAHAIDKDNTIAAMKAYQDGIALALKVDDSTFATPTVSFTSPAKSGRVEVTIG
jgi:crossover junction endodeoxyribonuclease RusA